MFARESKEEARGVYRFSEPLGTRMVSFYGIQEIDGWTLVDCGLPNSVRSWMEDGMLKGRIKRLIITHSDADHFGSAAWLKSKYPDMEILCHTEDKRYVEDHKAIVEERYDTARSNFGFGYSLEVLELLLTLCGDDFIVDRCLQGGETLKISKNDWNVLHLPGHSPGHISLLRKEDGLFIIGDAFLGEGPPDIQGNPSMPPTHDSVFPYLTSINRARGLLINKVLSGHWLPMDSKVFKDFLDTSEEVVYRDLEIVRRILSEGEKTFEEVLDQLNSQVAMWEASENAHYLYALNGYLMYLEKENKIVITAEQKIRLL